MSRKGINSIAINALYLSSAKLISSVARVLYAILLARLLGAELYGLFNYGLSWYVLFVPISALGLNVIIIREIGRDRSQASTLVGQTLALRTVATLIVALMSLILAWFFESDPLSRQLLFIFTLALIGRGLSLWAKAVFQAHESSIFVLALEVVFRLLEVLVGVSMLYAGYGVAEIALVHSVSWLLQGMISLGLIRRYFFKINFSWEKRTQVSLLKRGLPFVISSFLFGWILQGPILMYRHLEGLGTGLGQLALALQAFFIISAILSELGGAALPVLARSVDRGDGKSGYFIDLVLRGGAFMSGILAIVALVVGPWLVELLFGKGYELTAVLLPWTLLLVAPYFWAVNLSSVIVAHGRYQRIMLNNSIAAFVFTLASPVLVFLYDLIGLTMALALGLFLSAVSHLVTLQWYHSVNFLKVLFRSISAVFIGILITYQFLLLGPLVALVIGPFSLFGAFILFGLFRDQEVKMVLRFISSKVKKV